MINKVEKELKRTRVEDGNSSKARFEVQDKPRFEKRFPNQSPSTSPRINKVKRSIPYLQEGKVSGPYF